MRVESLDGDVVVVGGGPAGLTTALALVERVPRVRARLVVLEKDPYPREKICAGAVSGLGDALLARLDVRPAVPEVVMHGHAVRTARGLAVARPGHIGRVIRRAEFDAALAAAVRARGVRVVEGARVLGVTPAARGARVETTHGALHAAAVVGADGVGSVVRRAMGLRGGGLRAQVLEVDTEPVAGDLPRDLMHFDVSDRALCGYAWDFPTVVDGAPMVCRGVYQLALPGRAAVDLRAYLAARLAAVGLDLARCRGKRFAERGFAPADRLARGAMMLVGEAAGIDALSGEGIGPAIEYGVAAGRFLAEHLGGALDAWHATVSRSRLAFDLRGRAALIEPYYGGRARDLIDAWLVRSAAPLNALGDLFAGRAPRARDVAGTALSALRTAAGLVASRSRGAYALDRAPHPRSADRPAPRFRSSELHAS